MYNLPLFLLNIKIKIYNKYNLGRKRKHNTEKKWFFNKNGNLTIYETSKMFAGKKNREIIYIKKIDTVFLSKSLAFQLKIFVKKNYKTKKIRKKLATLDKKLY